METNSTTPSESRTTIGHPTTNKTATSMADGRVSLPKLIPATLCASCNKATPVALTCSTCRGVTYCSEECQKEDWPAHGKLCTTPSTRGPRPNLRSVRAIWFWSSHRVPMWIWLDYEEKPERHKWDQDQVALCRPPLGANFSVETSKSYSLPRKTVPFDDHPGELTIQFNNEKYSNNSIITATNGLASFDWKGSAVAYGTSPRTGKIPSYLFDLDMSDYSRIVEWLKSFNPHDQVHDS